MYFGIVGAATKRQVQVLGARKSMRSYLVVSGMQLTIA